MATIMLPSIAIATADKKVDHYYYFSRYHTKPRDDRSYCFETLERAIETLSEAYMPPPGLQGALHGG